jgi:hypothetical protein
MELKALGGRYRPVLDGITVEKWKDGIRKEKENEKPQLIRPSHGRLSESWASYCSWSQCSTRATVAHFPLPISSTERNLVIQKNNAYA